MTESRGREPSPGLLNVGDLLPGRLTAVAQVLASEIEAPIRAQYELPTKDWKVMQVLATGGALSPTEIHRVGGQNKAQISRALKCLLDRQLVAKQPHPEDHRTFVVSLTDSGLEMYAEIVEKMGRRQADILNKLPAGNTKQLRALIDSLEKAVKDYGSPDAGAL